MTDDGSGKTLYTLIIQTPAALAEAVANRLFEGGLRGLEEQEAGAIVRLLTYGNDRWQIEQYRDLLVDYLAHLAEIDAAAREVEIEITERQDADWATAWMKFFRQTPLGEGLVVQPSWDETTPPPGRRRLVIEPKMAFGYGTHASTRLAGAAVERFCRARPGGRVLDVGTGTGVLALAALMSGATFAVGVDTDPVAVTCARENAAINRLADRSDFSDTPLDVVEGVFDLVIANINTQTIVALADDLGRAVAPGGRLAMTGILCDDRPQIEPVFRARGWRLQADFAEEEWALLEWERG